LKIVSTIKNYEVIFNSNLRLDEDYFIIDRKVFNLHKDIFSRIDKDRIYLVEANELEKSYRRCADHIEHLILLGLKRGHTVAAIGGGTIQDLSGFITSIMYRGLSWNFYPTTLLAQCDSCIGGKTSINLTGYKNTVGNFNPPDKIFLNEEFLKTLSKEEIQSGLGEVLKVMIIDDKERIDKKDFLLCVKQSKIKSSILKTSLEIKKEIIEKDEFDKNIRNVMNYGHTFGHAIESLTEFKIPHGIAVGIGIKIANNTSVHLGLVEKEKMQKISKCVDSFVDCNRHYLQEFLKNFEAHKYLECLSKDKKNTDNSNLTCILLDKNISPFKMKVNNVKLGEILEKNIEGWFKDGS
jgi:3-dehydroquinate synthase